MTGAYCPTCGPGGPDVVIVPPTLEAPLGAVARMEFTCHGCGARLTWTATKTETAWRYQLEAHEPKAPP